MTNDLITLKEYLLDKLMHIEEARKLAFSNMERRLEGMNEFRDTLKDQASRFITREEADLKSDKCNSAMFSKIGELERDVQELRENKAKLEGKADQKSVNVVLIISIIGLGISVMGILIHWMK